MKRFSLAIAAALAAGATFANCGDDLGPDGTPLGVLAVQPVFASGASIVDVTAIRARLSRPGQDGFAADTTIPLESDSGTVEIPLTVQLREASENFLLEILIIGTQGDTVFKGGPDQITVASGTDEPTVAEIEIAYVGLGADAAGIFIQSQTLDVPTGAQLSLDAVVFDSTENVIQGAPILWSSLDTTRATVPDRETGVIQARNILGPVQIVAKTLTGQADTVVVNVIPPRPPQTVHWINAEGGSWTTGANWDLGSPPAPFDTAAIDLAGSYTVTLNTAVVLDAFILGTANRLDGQALLLQAAMGVGGDITLNTSGKLTLGAGSDVTGSQLALAGAIVGSAPSTTVAADIQGSGGVIDVSTGTLSIEGDLILITSDVIRGFGVLDLSNAGTVELGGSIAPGTSPGILALNHDPTFLTSTRLAIELEGTNVSQIDRLDINGTVTLGGVLDVLLPGAFVPAPGDTFTVMTYEAATGQFSAVNGTDLDLPNGLQLIPDYDETEFRLVTVGAQPVFTAQPSDALPGQDINPVIEIEFQDPVTGAQLVNFDQPVTLTLADNPTGANIVGEVQTFTDGPTAFFGSTGIDRLGSGYTLQVSAPSAFSEVSAPFDIIDGIVFAGTNGTFQAVSSLHADGSNLVNIASLQTAINFRSNPRWSPNRLRVVHSFVESSLGVREIHVASSGGDTVATIMGDTSGMRPVWNRSGDHIAFHCGDGFSVGQDVCTVQNIGTTPINALNNVGNGTGKTYVTDAAPMTGLDGPGVFAWDPSIPDRLAVVRTIPNQSRPVSQLFTVNADGSNGVALGAPLVLGPDTLNIEELAWAPDGSFLVFSAESEVTNRGRIYRVDRDGSNLQLLTGSPTAFYDENHPIVSPDGSAIIYIQNDFDFEGSDWNYFIVPATGGTPQQMSNETAFFIASDELGIDFSPDGTQVVFVGVDTSTGVPLPAIYVAPVSIRQATYFTDRVMISPAGRTDVQPNWRP